MCGHLPVRRSCTFSSRLDAARRAPDQHRLNGAKVIELQGVWSEFHLPGVYKKCRQVAARLLGYSLADWGGRRD